jgi:hypothetical protein
LEALFRAVVTLRKETPNEPWVGKLPFSDMPRIAEWRLGERRRYRRYFELGVAPVFPEEADDLDRIEIHVLLSFFASFP